MKRDWNEIQTKAKGLIEEGLKIIKEGAHEAHHIAGTTAKATKLHMKVSHNHMELYRVFYKIGKELYNECLVDPSFNSLKMTHTIKALLTEARRLEKEAHNAEKKLTKFTIIKKPKKTVMDNIAKNVMLAEQKKRRAAKQSAKKST